MSLTERISNRVGNRHNWSPSGKTFKIYEIQRISNRKLIFYIIIIEENIRNTEKHNDKTISISQPDERDRRPPFNPAIQVWWKKKKHHNKKKTTRARSTSRVYIYAPVGVRRWKKSTRVHRPCPFVLFSCYCRFRSSDLCDESADRYWCHFQVLFSTCMQLFRFGYVYWFVLEGLRDLWMLGTVGDRFKYFFLSSVLYIE